MSNFTAIRAVTETLERLIDQQMGVAVESKKSPDEVVSNTALIGLYLYRVEPNAFLGNLDWQRTSATELAAPPFALNLKYFVTPYGPDQLEIQQTLGELMRVFHEHAVIRSGDPALAPALADMTEELRIVPLVLPFNDMLEFWKGFEKAQYRLAVAYEVATIVIDNTATRSVQRVQERHLDLASRR